MERSFPFRQSRRCKTVHSGPWNYPNTPGSQSQNIQLYPKSIEITECSYSLFLYLILLFKRRSISKWPRPSSPVELVFTVVKSNGRILCLLDFDVDIINNINSYKIISSSFKVQS